jgi:hypothetical protein
MKFPLLPRPFACSTALCLLYGPLPLYGPFAPLWPSPILRLSVSSMALCRVFSPLPPRWPSAPLYGPLPLYDPLPSLWISTPPYSPCPFTAHCHLNGALSSLRLSVPSTALCPHLRRSVPSTALCPLHVALSPL